MRDAALTYFALGGSLPELHFGTFWFQSLSGTTRAEVFADFLFLLSNVEVDSALLRKNYIR